MAGSACRADFEYLRRVVLARSQNVLDPSRNYLFETKLARLVRNCGLDDLHGLVQRMQRIRDPQLESAVADAMTVNETSFFRDRRPFELLREQLLPELIDARGNRTLCVWSAACSTGQEVYSLAMLIREHFPMLAGWRVHIGGTDICKDALERATAASYERIEVNRGLPARYLAKYFDHCGERWVVKPEVRTLCSFRRVNLADTPLPFHHRFDVILMRNVMLYFGPQVRGQVMAEVHRLLMPDGVLIMGATEQPPELSMWQPILARGTCYFRPVRVVAA